MISLDDSLYKIHYRDGSEEVLGASDMDNLVSPQTNLASVSPVDGVATIERCPSSESVRKEKQPAGQSTEAEISPPKAATLQPTPEIAEPKSGDISLPPVRQISKVSKKTVDLSISIMSSTCDTKNTLAPAEKPKENDNSSKETSKEQGVLQMEKESSKVASLGECSAKDLPSTAGIESAGGQGGVQRTKPASSARERPLHFQHAGSVTSKKRAPLDRRFLQHAGATTKKRTSFDSKVPQSSDQSAVPAKRYKPAVSSIGRSGNRMRMPESIPDPKGASKLSASATRIRQAQSRVRAPAPAKYVEKQTGKGKEFGFAAGGGPVGTTPHSSQSGSLAWNAQSRLGTHAQCQFPFQRNLLPFMPPQHQTRVKDPPAAAGQFDDGTLVKHRVSLTPRNSFEASLLQKSSGTSLYFSYSTPVSSVATNDRGAVKMPARPGHSGEAQQSAIAALAHSIAKNRNRPEKGNARDPPGRRVKWKS